MTTTLLKNLAAGLLAATLSVTPLLARDLTGTEMTALKARIASFGQAVEANNIAAIESVVPPKLTASMAAQFGMSVEELKAQMLKVMTDAMAKVDVVSYEMATDQAVFSETSAGRVYGLIPSQIVMKIDGSTMQGNNQTLAFADDGVWYLVRIDDANQVRFLTQAYPEFKGINFPKGTLKVIGN